MNHSDKIDISISSRDLRYLAIFPLLIASILTILMFAIQEFKFLIPILILCLLGYLILKTIKPSYTVSFDKLTNEIIVFRLSQSKYINIKDVTNLYEDHFILTGNNFDLLSQRQKYILRAKDENGKIITYPFNIWTDQTVLIDNYNFLRYTILLDRKKR